MKVWYDRKTKSRCFEPGDGVLVLFPFVGNPLQAKYSGPYKVVKKISDTNYLVRTPGRCKETQLCHINMLKAYHENPKPELVIPNNKLGLENPTHSESCVGLEAKKEEPDTWCPPLGQVPHWLEHLCGTGPFLDAGST